MTYLAPQEYLPHTAPMLMLEEVVAVDAETAHCRVKVCSQGVLAPFLTSTGALPNWYALELMAQTIGVWSGWHSVQAGNNKILLGMILGARDLHTQCREFPANAMLNIKVSLLMRDDRLGSFSGTLSCEDTVLASGRINTFQPTEDELSTLFA